MKIDEESMLKLINSNVNTKENKTVENVSELRRNVLLLPYIQLPLQKTMLVL